MRRISKAAAALTIGGALTLGGIAAAAPVLARAGGSGGPPATQSQVATPGTPGAGRMAGRMAGGGPANGTCWNLPAPSGNVTAAQKATLASMADEEKLAHDLYAAFAGRYDARIFDQIAAAETQHLTAVRTLLGRYGVTDPTAGKSAGQFGSAQTKATYDRLLAQGSASEKAALGVGVSVEKADIAALNKADDGLAAADVKQVYNRLLTASQRHLAAFQAWSG